jgi:hypothetical protein
MAARWIILTPSLDDEAWLAAITAGAAEAGLVVIQAHPDHPQWLMDDPRTVVIANMPVIARDAGARVEAVVVPRPDTTAARAEQLFGLQMPQSLWVASQIVAEALSLDGARLFDGATLAAATAAIELLPGLRVTPPASAGGTAAGPAVEPMRLFGAGRPPPGATTRWEPGIFCYDDRAARSGETGVLDVTGRPRLLVYGPYVCLTPGIWRQTARFSLDEAAAPHRFRLDWGTQSEWTSHEIIGSRPGVYEIELEHLWTAAVPAEFRILLMEGAFAGTLTFMGGEATLVRAADDAALTAAA